MAKFNLIAFVWWCNISFRIYFLLSKNSVQIKATAAYTYKSNAKNSFCPYFPTFHFHHSKFCWLLAPAPSPKLPASSLQLPFNVFKLTDSLWLKDGDLQQKSDFYSATTTPITIQLLSNARELNAQNLKNNYIYSLSLSFF